MTIPTEEEQVILDVLKDIGVPYVLARGATALILSKLSRIKEATAPLDRKNNA